LTWPGSTCTDAAVALFAWVHALTGIIARVITAALGRSARTKATPIATAQQQSSIISPELLSMGKINALYFFDKKSTAGRVSCQPRESSSQQF
jgi:hypothetical protein